MYGNLFKSGVVSGIGANSATGGLASGSSGKIDARKLTHAAVHGNPGKEP